MATEQLGSREIEPRVVILEGVENASVEVFDLPKPVAIGTEFECQGKVWRITANRPRTRVFLAQVLKQIAVVDLFGGPESGPNHDPAESSKPQYQDAAEVSRL